jgi:hypothetical protein
MANLTKNTFTGGGAVETLVAAASGGDTVQTLTRQDFLIVKNSNATLPRTVTLNSQETCNQGSDHDLAIVVAALTTQLIKPPAPATRWKDTNGAMQIAYSAAAADLTVGAFTMPD